MKIIFKDRNKHFLIKKQKAFATVIDTFYDSLYSIDPDALTLMYRIMYKKQIKVIPHSQVVKVLS